MTQITITCPPTYPGGNVSGKISVIKALRDLSGMGLKEAKDASESTMPQIISIRSLPQKAIEDNFKMLKANGVVIGPRIQEILDELRKLATEAMRLHEDDLANEILQLVLAQKLRTANGPSII